MGLSHRSRPPTPPTLHLTLSPHPTHTSIPLTIHPTTTIHDLKPLILSSFPTAVRGICHPKPLPPGTGDANALVTRVLDAPFVKIFRGDPEGAYTAARAVVQPVGEPLRSWEVVREVVEDWVGGEVVREMRQEEDGQHEHESSDTNDGGKKDGGDKEVEGKGSGSQNAGRPQSIWGMTFGGVGQSSKKPQSPQPAAKSAVQVKSWAGSSAWGAKEVDEEREREREWRRRVWEKAGRRVVLVAVVEWPGDGERVRG
ncbi:hypothetical protein EX30DRAFT_340186 [Ascodesmis nigricans]|uniref:Uncharacterized protein n=1 Tax=Ascodesmis nigricans TaxID=341454 RepID=A0A4S2MZR1_9PEZI|nr:hypothetical protein EX30DRAFT_340186 [Ascodesmis nigricans]